MVGDRLVMSSLVVGGVGRHLVSVVRSVIVGCCRRIMAMMRGFGRRVFLVVGLVVVAVTGRLGCCMAVIVVAGVVGMTVIGGLDRRRVMVIVAGRRVVTVIAMIVRRRSGRMGIVSGRVGRVLMTGVMRCVRIVRGIGVVRVVSLVFVAHVTPVPQPLCTVFDRETGIT